MGKIKELLDSAKAKKGIETDYALAAELGIPRALVHYYYKGERIPDEYACMKIAEILEIPLDVVIANVRSESEKDETRREAWKRYAKKLVRIAASFMIAALLGLSSTTLIMTGEAKAQTQQGIQSGESEVNRIQIMRLLWIFGFSSGFTWSLDFWHQIQRIRPSLSYPRFLWIKRPVTEACALVARD
ncbi:hypothetical protein [Propionivibrio sp.]|uniref:hypothetical protein n=1 Tax=Propionivibrio sp. TaxID=2212460 RepID=UPI002611BD50|nr:hypothetical protein [Propionivibrio sp.]